MEKKEWTGERLETFVVGYNTIEHLHRYAFAKDFVAGKTVLDIACGEGYGSNLLAGTALNVIGVDISTDTITNAAAKYKQANLTFKVGSASEIPVKNYSVDVVVSFETLEHHNLHEEMLSEIKRILVPGGLLIMSSPDKKNYTDIPGYKNPFHVKELYLSEFKKLINKYFKQADFLNQKLLTASLIVNTNAQKLFGEYGGNYDFIEKKEDFLPVYNLCIASDNQLPAYINSVFDGSEVSRLMIKEAIDQAAGQMANHIKSSIRYKIGDILLAPLNIFKRK